MTESKRSRAHERNEVGERERESKHGEDSLRCENI